MEIDELVHITEYQASWPAQFRAEHVRIVTALSLAHNDVQHIGSTAVPGLAAKPIIDLMVGITEFPPSGSLVQRIVGLGYQPLGEAGVPGRLHFRRRGHARMNLHLVARGKSHWVRNLALRDYLRANADARERYAQAKRYAVASGANRLLAYSAAKSSVLESLLREALDSDTV